VIRRRPETVLAALLAAALVLVAVELATGALSEPSPALANPCRPREVHTGGGLDATIQRIVLDGLDGAACRLHTTREEIVLSLGSGTGVRRRWDRRTIEIALRAGLLHSVDEAEQRGDVPEFVASLLRRVVRAAPLDRLIEGGIRLSDLIG
jgi:hypothetical protein